MAIYTGSNKHLGGTEHTKSKETFYFGLTRKNVLVTGAGGQLGMELMRRKEMNDERFRFFYTDAHQLDITVYEQVAHFVQENGIDFIINCAAYTAVDKAETDQAGAYAVNATGAENLARAATAANAKLIHISTDYVLDGKGHVPLKENDATGPTSVYGASKLKGETAVMQHASQWIIIRTSWLFSEYGANFVKTMMRLMKERNHLTVVADQHGSPTYAADLAEMLFVILDEPEWKQGLYHFANGGITTWFDFATAIKDEINAQHCNIVAVSSEEYITAAKRPAYSALDTTKIEAAYGVVIPSWQDALKRCLNRMSTTNK